MPILSPIINKLEIITNKPACKSRYYNVRYQCNINHSSWLICDCTEAKLMRLEDMGLSIWDMGVKNFDKLKEII